jgi:hypothetical protein
MNTQFWRHTYTYVYVGSAGIFLMSGDNDIMIDWKSQEIRSFEQIFPQKYGNRKSYIKAEI